MKEKIEFAIALLADMHERELITKEVYNQVLHEMYVDASDKANKAYNNFSELNKTTVIIHNILNELA